MRMKKLRIGIDTGGTFTDFVIIRDGRIEIIKEPSTPRRPEQAILDGLNRMRGSGGEIIHGSTVATNALLERNGVPVLLLTTEGFGDMPPASKHNLGNFRFEIPRFGASLTTSSKIPPSAILLAITPASSAPLLSTSTVSSLLRGTLPVFHYSSTFVN